MIVLRDIWVERTESLDRLVELRLRNENDFHKILPKLIAIVAESFDIANKNCVCDNRDKFVTKIFVATDIVAVELGGEFVTIDCRANYCGLADKSVGAAAFVRFSLTKANTTWVPSKLDSSRPDIAKSVAKAFAECISFAKLSNICGVRKDIYWGTAWELKLYKFAKSPIAAMHWENVHQMHRFFSGFTPRDKLGYPVVVEDEENDDDRDLLL